MLKDKLLLLFEKMGGSSSKQSSEIERNRRLKEFEEEFVGRDNNDGRSTRSNSIGGGGPRDLYFSQEFYGGPNASSTRFNKSNITGKRGEDDENDTQEEEQNNGKGNDDDESVKNSDKKEVDDAIAELEETFRSLSPTSKGAKDKNAARTRDVDASETLDFEMDSGTEEMEFLSPSSLTSNNHNISRSHSCGPLTTQDLDYDPEPKPTEAFKKAKGIVTPTHIAITGLPHGNRERRGTPIMGPPVIRHHNRRPLGLAHHLSKSSGGLSVNGGGEEGESIKGALALSAPSHSHNHPPTHSRATSEGPSSWKEESSLGQHWEEPKIDGFDVDKFREANRPKPSISISVRLPSSNASTDSLKPSNPSQRMLQTPPSPLPYTKDELELFKTLERDVPILHKAK